MSYDRVWVIAVILICEYLLKAVTVVDGPLRYLFDSF